MSASSKPAFKTLDHAQLSGQRVLLRVDLNVPMEQGKVTDATRIERRTDRRAQPLPERPGRHVHEVQPRRGVPLEVRIELPQVQQVRALDESGFGPGRIEQRCGMALRQHETIVTVVAQILVKYHQHGVERRQIAGGATGHEDAASRLRHPGDVRQRPQLGDQLFDLGASKYARVINSGVATDPHFKS